MPLGTAKYGMPNAGPVRESAAPAASNAAVTPGHAAGWVENPTVWLVAIAAVTLGLIGASTSARLGPVRASISAGKA